MTNGIAPSALVGDTNPDAYGAVALRLIFPQLYTGGYTDLAGWWSPVRDAQLAATIGKEAMWSAAVGQAKTKIAALGWNITDSQDSDRRVKASQDLLLGADGEEGWVSFIQKVLGDYLTTDNGCFIRVRTADERSETIKVKEAAEGAAGPQYQDVTITSSAPGGKVVGLYHLDSLACTRTGNLRYPVRYVDARGQWHLLRFDQVLWVADQPSARQGMFGVGHCAASRCYQTIAKLVAMEQLVYEYLTGGGAHKIAFVQGLMDTTLKGIVDTAKADAQAKGFLYYMGTILGAVPSDTPLSTIEIELKKLLDGFSPKEERDNAYLIYANAIGLPLQDIQPLSGQGLGTGTQTAILDEAAEGKGIASFLKWLVQTLNRRVLPKTTEFEWSNRNDARDQKNKAEVAKIRAETRKVRIESGEISVGMARQIALDDGDLAKDLAGVDATPAGSLTDDEKLVEAVPSPEAQRLIAGLPTAMPSAQPGTPATKSAALLAGELEAARLLAEWASE